MLLLGRARILYSSPDQHLLTIREAPYKVEQLRNSPAHLTRPSRDQSCLRAAETGSTGARRELSRQLVRRVRRTLRGWQHEVARTKEGKTSQVTTWLISFVYYDCSTVCVYITFLYVAWHRITKHQPVDNKPAWPVFLAVLLHGKALPWPLPYKTR